MTYDDRTELRHPKGDKKLWQAAALKITNGDLSKWMRSRLKQAALADLSPSEK